MLAGIPRSDRREFACLGAGHPPTPPRIHPFDTGRPFGRPVWRGRLHSWAFALAIPAGLFLVTSAESSGARLAGAIYATTVVLLFGTSAAYHRLTRTERSRSIMRRIDHSMIYVMVAGTYAPICLVALPRSSGVPMMGVVIATAAIGIVLKTFVFERARTWSYALYPTMAAFAVVAMPTLVDHLTATQFALVAGGTVAYGVGALVLLTARPDPWPGRFGYHEVWHGFTIVASTLHFVAIAGVLT
jgi:hemolysin III